MKRKFICTAFVFVCLCLLTVLPVNAGSSKSRSEALSWVASKEWTTVGSGQCVALISAYYEYLGFYGVSGNGGDYSWNEIPDGLGWREQGGVPNPGDILVYTGGYGHVAICGDSTNVSWHQNWSGQYVQWVNRNYYDGYSYNGNWISYWGCIHINFNDDNEAPTISNYRISNATGDGFTISADLYDNVGVASVWLNIYGPGGEKGYRVSASNGNFSHYISYSDYGGYGSYSIHLYAQDGADNQSSSGLNNIYPTADLGNESFGVILNKACWKPIEVCDDGYVRLATEKGVARQVWKFVREGNGSYKIISAENGKLLDVYNGETDDGTAILTWEDKGGSNQRWAPVEHYGGYLLYPCNSGNKILDLDNNNASDGTKIQIWTRHGGEAQIFSIYRGDEVQLKGANLTVKPGTSTTSTVFDWNNVYGCRWFDLKIWNGTYWVGDAYHLGWGAKQPYSVKLPAGHYEAYVDSTNALEMKMSNVVAFDVPEDSSAVNIFSKVTGTDTGYNVHADIKYLTQSVVYVAALYSSDGTLLDIQTTPVDSGDTSADVVFTKHGGAAYAKVFLWDNIKSMQVITESERINV